MAQYVGIIGYFGLFVFFIVSDFLLYYGYGKNHSRIPFYLGLAVTVIVGGITLLAIYETFKHRNDKEPW